MLIYALFISDYRKMYTGPKKARDGKLEKATADSYLPNHKSFIYVTLYYIFYHFGFT